MVNRGSGEVIVSHMHIRALPYIATYKSSDFPDLRVQGQVWGKVQPSIEVEIKQTLFRSTRHFLVWTGILIRGRLRLLQPNL